MTILTTHGSGHHGGQPVLAAGEPLDQARAAMVMVHGRGASARDILSLAGEFLAEDMAFLAPQAAGNTWYPYSFLEPMERNEPYLSSALAQLGWLVETIESTGVPAECVILLGFSQGACLLTEYAARNARRYGGVAGLSGGLIGPPGTPRDYGGSMDGTPVFLGCSDVDFHIPKERVLDTAEVFRTLGADVTDRIYPGMGHTIIRDEIEHVQRIIERLEAS
jgi:phospholipase/carboxylesterase